MPAIERAYPFYVLNLTKSTCNSNYLFIMVCYAF